MSTYYDTIIDAKYDTQHHFQPFKNGIPCKFWATRKNAQIRGLNCVWAIQPGIKAQGSGYQDLRKINLDEKYMYKCPCRVVTISMGAETLLRI